MKDEQPSQRRVILLIFCSLLAGLLLSTSMRFEKRKTEVGPMPLLDDLPKVAQE